MPLKIDYDDGPSSIDYPQKNLPGFLFGIYTRDLLAIFLTHSNFGRNSNHSHLLDL